MTLMTTITKARTGARGFSMLELLFVVALMTVVVAAVFTQIAQVQQRARTEQAKLDIFQQPRDFADQLSRDLHQAGYPSVRMFNTAAWSVALVSPPSSDSRLATGLILIGPGEIQFEGDVDGSGKVSVLDYKLASSGNNCPCLQRSQVLKSTGGTVFSNEVQNVQSVGTTADAIFAGYTATGTAVLTGDMTSTANKQALASIKTVRFQLKVKSAVVDPLTRLAPETTISSQTTIGNCSLATAGQANSC
jgi:prepilin-type N-terminal cleavage/methylation domain-containing protein